MKCSPYRELLKRMPIILLKGTFLYLIVMSNTTSIIGPITQECSDTDLLLFTLLIGLLIGLIMELTKEI